MDIRLALLVVLSTVQVSLASYGQTAKCNQEIIKKINQLKGNTETVYQYAGKDWYLRVTTETNKYNNVSCQKFTTEGNGKLTINTDGKISHVQTSETGNKLTIIGDNDEHYKVVTSLAKGVYAGYHCATNGPVINPALPPDCGVVSTAAATQQDIDDAVSTLKGVGCSVTKKYSCVKIDNVSSNK